MLFVQFSCEYLAAPDSGCSRERDSGERDHGLQELSCSMDITRSRIIRLRELEFLGVGRLPVMNKLEPLIQGGPVENFQMTFMAIPIDTRPR
jgi:hypothetical protein